MANKTPKQLTVAPNADGMTVTLDIEGMNRNLALLSAQIFPPGMQLMYLSVDDVREQDLNAQSMPKAMFDQLTQNIRDAGTPESVPLLAKTERGIENVSGHHRIRASRAAEVKMFLGLVYDNLPQSRIFSKQLAHNSIHGTSDPELIQRIWLQIDDVKARFESFIDPRSFEGLKPVSFKPVDVDMVTTAKNVLIVFLPTQMIDFDAAMETILPKGDVDKVYVAHRDTFDAFKAALQQVRADLDIVNAPTALAEMARLAVERLDELKDDGSSEGS